MAQGRKLKQSNAALFASIEQRYGVPAGPLIAIWGMETAFGKLRGNENIVVRGRDARLRLPAAEFFTDHLYAALKLVDNGTPLRFDARLGCMVSTARRSSCPRRSCSTAAATSTARPAR